MGNQHPNINILISIIWFAHFIEADYTPYGTPHTFPWLTHNPYPYPSYTTKSHWYPVPGPYTYGPPIQDHYTTPFPYHHEYPPNFSQQQIMHIHDVEPPEIPDSDQERNNYNIHSIISHVDQDLTGEASSNVEIRKPIRNSTNTNSKLNKRRIQNKRADNKRRQNQSKRHRPIEAQYKTKPKNTFKKPIRSRQPNRLTQQRQNPQFRRKEAPRRKQRPTQRTHYRRPYYNYDYEYNGRRRESERYRKNDYRNFQRGVSKQDYDYDYEDDDYYYYDYDNYDETTSIEPTTTEEEEEITTTTIGTTTFITTTTTEAPETITIVPTTGVNTTVSGEVLQHYDPHGYGPSNGNENISITYSPIVHDSNFWHYQQGVPDIFHYKNYFSSRDIFN